METEPQPETSQTESSIEPPISAEPTEIQEKPKRKLIRILAFTLLGLLITIILAFGAYKLSKPYKPQPTPPLSKFTPTPFPSLSPSPIPEVTYEEIKIINGNVCQVKTEGEVKILVNKDDFQSEYIRSFDAVKVSPDGTKICFLGYSPVPIWLYYAHIDGSNVTKVDSGKNCVWSPDSKKIAYNNHTTDVSPTDVLAYDTISGEIENLTKDAAPEGFIRFYGLPEWSEDSLTITSSFESVNLPGMEKKTKGISVINLSTKEIIDK